MTGIFITSEMCPYIVRPWEYKSVLEQCISHVAKFENRSADLGPVASIILEQFLLGAYFSAYQITSKLKDKSIPYLSFIRGKENTDIAYKDVHKRIRRLDLLGLIERVPKEQISTKRESIHSPIFYRLTLGGIFNLLYKNMDVMFTENKNEIFQHHGNNIIFNTFLYPYFEQSTLIGIKGSFLPEVIFSYLSKCCKITDEIIRSLTKDGNRPVPIDLFQWNEFPGNHDIEIMRTIGNEFEVDLSEDSKIEKYHNNTMIKISDKHHRIIIKINCKSNLATLTVHDGRTYDLFAERSDNDLLISKIGEFREDIALPVMQDMIRHNLLNLAFSMIMAREMGGPVEDSLEVRMAVNAEDFKILAQDQKVAHLVEETYELFIERYKVFVGLMKMNMSG